MDSLPVQPLPRDSTRLVAAKKAAPVAKMHPAAKTAADAWKNLHGHKFEKNAGRLGKK